MKTLQIRRAVFLLVPIFLFFAGNALAGPVVLFDQAHAQQFLVEKDRPLDLSGLADVFIDQGAEIRTSDKPLSDQTLGDVDVLIISGPFAPISTAEVVAIMKFVYRGGKLAVMAHISQPLMNLMPQLGIAVSSAAVSEQENVIGANPRDFQIKDLSPHPLTRDLESFNVYGGWALLHKKKEITIVGRTSPRAWVDLNQNGELNEKDAVQSFSMALAGEAGKGSFVVFGDDAIFQNQFLKDGNLKLARNMAIWFCGSGRSI
ncbi:MAG: DUF4350 domain-containing protein [Pseudomonadota bacterium]